MYTLQVLVASGMYVMLDYQVRSCNQRDQAVTNNSQDAPCSKTEPDRVCLFALALSAAAHEH